MKKFKSEYSRNKYLRSRTQGCCYTQQTAPIIYPMLQRKPLRNNNTKNTTPETYPIQFSEQSKANKQKAGKKNRELQKKIPVRVIDLKLL